MNKKIVATKISKKLKELFPRADIALNFRSNWELLVAVMLSAQTTDIQVNKVTAELFQKYKTLDDYLRVGQIKFAGDIARIGLYRTKAKNILDSAKIIKSKHGGRVPQTMDELIALPGVGRKTANVVLGVAFKKAEGIVVDTHVRRFALKFGLSQSKDPKIIEQDLMKLFPRKDWQKISYRFIEYGREICPARKHECQDHPLTKIFPPSAHRWPSAQ